ncbi:PLP-dependent transferase [Marinobacter zhanjiangensis]|uniref:PLP-dependent transferase n=1 Tax=Marinobacter zhanjiangensis TaxID=578215 RepID=UPI0027E52ED6|nr:PLP-dependent transferase [Marinobacter zhanjiangensis]
MNPPAGPGGACTGNFRRSTSGSLNRSTWNATSCFPASSSDGGQHHGISQQERERQGITDGMLRLSVGLEDAGDLTDDLNKALATAQVASPLLLPVVLGRSHGLEVYRNHF